MANTSIVKGVNIASKGDIHFLKKKKFYAVDIPANHIIFTDTTGTIKPNLCIGEGIPILVRQQYGNVNNEWKESALKADPPVMPMQNRTAMFLNIDTHIGSEVWGFADLTVWDPDIGTVLVVRQDRKDITPEQVEAIAGFCRYKLSPQLSTLETYLFALEMYVSADGLSEEKDVATRKERFIEEEMCREKFEAYFENLKQFKVGFGSAAWEKVVSPYSV